MEAGALTPPLEEHLSRLGTQLGFAAAASELGLLRRVTVAEATARRRTEAAGATLVTVQAAAALRAATAPRPLAGPPVQQVSVDGVMVPLVKGAWGEVKLLAIGTVGPGRTSGTVQTTGISYCGRMAPVEEFCDVAGGEVHRRGVATAATVAGVVDGALWCQRFLDVHRPDAVRILDFAHAGQRLTAVAEAVWGPGAAASAWAAVQREELRERDPDQVLAAVRALPAVTWPVEAPLPAPPTVEQLTLAAAAVRDETLGYLAARREQIAYAAFRAQGLPIGSGMVESGNKLVVAARLKGAGRQWAPAHVNPMVALRADLCSGRWAASWREISQARRVQARAQTQARRVARRPPVSVAPPIAPPPPTRRSVPPPAIGALPPMGGRKLVVNGRPTAHHPWKRTFRPPNPTSPAAIAKL